MEIKNKPKYADGYKYIVVRECDNEYWFWGAYDDGNLASLAVLEIGGILVYNN